HARLPDSARHARLPDSARHARLPDGTRHARLPDGTRHARLPDGTRHAGSPAARVTRAPRQRAPPPARAGAHVASPPDVPAFRPRPAGRGARTSADGEGALHAALAVSLDGAVVRVLARRQVVDREL